jgi:transcriptional antiterminator RfaH
MTDPKDCECSWFLIHTKVKQEERTTNNLRAWDIETLSPQIRDWRSNQFTGERCYFVKPLFARYVFARFNFERFFHKVRYARGVQEFVSFGDGPVVVEEEVISLIRSRVGKDGFVTMGSDLEPGDRVLMKEGPLKDITGIFEREMMDSQRVVLLLNTVNYQARVQVERDLLCKVSHLAC